MNTVAKVMAEKDLVARRQHRRRSTTRSDRSARKAPGAVTRVFTQRERPVATWCGDLTEIPTEEGTVYLAGILDLHSRICVGFAMDAHHDVELARAALQVAIAVHVGTVRDLATALAGEQPGRFTEPGVRFRFQPAPHRPRRAYRLST